MIPDFQTLMRPVLECAAPHEIRITDVVENLANRFKLSQAERDELLPSGKQTRFANRVHWAKSYLIQAGLAKATKRAHYIITERGKVALADSNAVINRVYLEQFDEFKVFQARTRLDGEAGLSSLETLSADIANKATPDETLRQAHETINASLATELLERVRTASPAFFERLIVELLLAMGYGGTTEETGRTIGGKGDDGVDGVIDQDPLGVDQIYIQAKRYIAGNQVGPAAIRDFFGALSLKKVQKGIFVTTSSFSSDAARTAKELMRIVLIDGDQLAKLMIRYNIGCREEEVLYLKKVDEDFFE